LSQILDSVAPQNQYYRDLATMLQRMREIDSTAPFRALAPAPSVLKIGVRSQIVRELKKRAYAMGYPITSLDDTFDESLASAIRRIQRANLSSVTGQLSPKDQATWEFFSISSARRIQQIELNMEKARWLPREMESRYVIVNLATQRMRVVDPNLTNPVLVEQSVVVGRPDRKTPSMREELEFVVLNPTWTVPPDIFRLDKIPAIQKAAAIGPQAVVDWFQTNRMSLLNRDEKPVNPTDYNWLTNPPQYGNVLIRQQPGLTNALGAMKFMMPNPYSIYLHDTNQPELLKNDFRMLSSGCIRMSYPRDFAEYLLAGTKWNRTAIDDFVVKPGETRSSESWIRLPNKVKVPVYLISLTAALDDNSVMQFTRDVYGQNASLLKALKTAGFYRAAN
jgi:murein L,D-transpeptidase YcbB/YkuD